MIQLDLGARRDEHAQVYDNFMSDVVAVDGDVAQVAAIGRLLQSALDSDCDCRLWAAVDRQLALLLHGAARHAYQPAICRLYSFLRENHFGA